MPSARSKLGSQGEAVAAAHLRAAGLTLMERNFRTRYGEVDLVARDGDAIVFIEVKTRRGNAYGGPEESVTRRKRGRLAKTAMHYLQAHGLEQRSWRIDVVGITLHEGAAADITYVRGIDLGAG